MDIEQQLSDSTATIAISGRFTFRDNETFVDHVDKLKTYKHSDIIFDLAGLEYIDSFGIGLLSLARDSVEELNKRFSIINATGMVKEILNHFQIPHGEQRRAPSAHMPFVVDRQQSSGATHGYVLRGSFKMAQQDVFLPVIQSIEAEAYTTLRLDLSELTMIDSTGLSLIMTAFDELRKRDRRMVLVEPQGKVLDLLRMMAIDTVIPIQARA